MYLVIETCDRMASDLRPAKDIRDAVDKANELLKAHCTTLDKPKMYDAIRQAREARRMAS